ncbi:WD40/YVTN/BNR-like repeat-containing protein [Streptomyces agglomeratus]|uniref:WD40/YVTN/BNR-like repeat-containing protein n=1 Tax=Streptomyces agglomeratus TaxID=285458 RepID=UPI000B1B3AC5|nr:exo-alpha-sialidase [Streptomyces agglomeratus]
MRKPFTPLGAAGAVLVALMLLLGCGGGGAAKPPGPSKPAAGPVPESVPVPVPVPVPRIPSGRELPGSAHMVGFAADGSGFALLAKCVQDTGQPENGFCRQYVGVRDKGARSWRLREAPLADPSGTDGVSADLRVLGSGRAWVHESVGDHRFRTWFTADGGRSWQARGVRPEGVVRSIAKGAALSTLCGYPTVPDGEACAKDQLLVMSPDDGRLRVLGQRPPLAGLLSPAAYAEPDGSWWVSGKHPVTGGPAVAVSRDAGRTWQASVLDSPAKKPGWDVRVSVGDGVVYAAETGELPAGEAVKNPLRAVHRSRDGGRMWERTWTTGAVREPRSLTGVPVPGAGDTLLLGAERGHYTSVDGGRTFDVTSSDPATGHASTIPLGRLVSGDPCTYRISADGVRWSTFTLGTCDD